MRTMDNDVVVVAAAAVVAVVNSNNNNNDSMNINVYTTNWLTFVFKERDRKKCTFAGVWLLIWVDVIKTITFYWLQNIRQLEMYSWCFLCVDTFFSIFYEIFFRFAELYVSMFFFCCCRFFVVKYIQSLSRWTAVLCACVCLQHIRLSFWLNTFNFSKPLQFHRNASLFLIDGK